MRLLVVDDNPQVSRVLVRAFSEEGYVVDRVADGALGLEQITAVSYDVAILDWMLPGMDGVTVCRTARARGVKTPILILTARAEPGSRDIAIDAGASDYVAKPFDLDELVKRVRSIGDRSA